MFTLFCTNRSDSISICTSDKVAELLDIVQGCATDVHSMGEKIHKDWAASLQQREEQVLLLEKGFNEREGEAIPRTRIGMQQSLSVTELHDVRNIR